MNPFFVTCLPRSRSAWLANWLTTDKSICYHDQPYTFALATVPQRVVGFAGPELIKQANWIFERFPGAPWLVVTRNPEEALLSFKAWAGDRITVDEGTLRWFWYRREVDLAIIGSRPMVMTVKFDGDLDDSTMAPRIWAHLLPGIEFDAERWNMLRALNVQQDLKKKASIWRSEQLEQLEP